ncbi:NUDIX hydrolase [Micromonospora endolithica]|uniref:NUDIX domain-containing protein n=1 Tax=Micromonospora endolithica TaxID=230091 RepID=A0A3A9YSB6_9ACTN|nr:NUDIX domain-containing protein [Micromonospora endolithica]RKN38883.1 NUDIX domain-containing protein [Micromonospora endolithica]TWJ25508.1 isopentenyldiphosphate isomerase [Micromonospora endolithica]
MMENADSRVSNDELVEAVDHRGNPIGIVGRQLANRLGIWHVCAQVFVLAKVEGVPAVVFQRRSRTKTVSPGVLDISASGHVVAGQTVQSAAARELAEELGLKVSADSLVHVGRRVDMYEAPGVLSRIFADVYVVVTDQDPGTLNFDPVEIDELVVVPAADLLGIFVDGSSPSCHAYQLDKQGLARSRRVVVRASDFLPRFDNLYARIARYANDRETSGSSARFM